MVAGGYAYGYLFMSQNHLAETVFCELLGIVRPNQILEIGTFHGGLTLMLRDIMDRLELKTHPIKTYDINDQEFLKPLVIDRNVEVLTKNIFKEDYTNFRNDQSYEELKDFIQKPGTTMVLCDGGCKRCEFNLIAPLLKKQDIIMAHDYAPDQIYFENYMKDKLWNWLEIQDSDIEQIINQENLVSFYQDLTQQAAWCCKIKD